MTIRALRAAALAGVSLALLSTAASAAIEIVTVTAERRSENIQTVPIAVSAFSSSDLKVKQIRDFNDLQLASPSLLVSTGSGDTSGGLVRIRGVGTTGNNAGLEASVGVFVDGVYRNRSAAALEDLIDVERIEVLRGPQGTLFGKNTTAGVVSIISRKPSQTPELDADASGGTLGYYRFSARGTTGITDNFAVSASALYRAQSGFLTNVNTGPFASGTNDNPHSNAKKHVSFKGQALWTPTPDIEVYVTGDFSQKVDSGSDATFKVYSTRDKLFQDVINPAYPHDPGFASLNFGKVFPTPVVLGQFGPADQFVNFKSYVYGSNHPRISDVNDYGFSGEVDWTINDDASLVSITAYRDFKSHDDSDPDYSPTDVLFIHDSRGENRTLTEELQLKGSMYDVDWLLGGFFSSEQIRGIGPLVWGADSSLVLAHILNPFGNVGATGGSSTAACTLGLANANPVCVANGLGGVHQQLFQAGDGYTDHFSTQGQSLSFFTHETWHITDEWSLTGGLRFNHENKHGKYDGGVMTWHVDPAGNALKVACGTALHPPFNNYFAGFNLLCQRDPYDVITSEDSLTGTANVSYKPTDMLMFYASYSRGYKAGPVNLDRNATITGVISAKPEYDDSIEVGARTAWFDNTAIINLTLFHERFKDFQINTFNGISFAVANEKHVYADGFELETTFVPTDGLVLGASATYAYSRYGHDVVTPAVPLSSPVFLAGRQLTQAPAWTLNGSFNYERALGIWGLTGDVGMNVNYRSKYNTGSDLNPNKLQPSFALVNAHLGFRCEDSMWDLQLWGRNVFNEHYNVVAFNTPVQQASGTNSDTSAISVFPGEPAIYGLTLTLHE